MQQNYPKFKLSFSKLTNILVLVVSVIFAICAVLCIVFHESLTLPAVIVTIILLLLSSVFLCLMAYYSFYVFTPSAMLVRFGIIWFSIPYDNMCLVRESKETKEIFLFYIKQSRTSKDKPQPKKQEKDPTLPQEVDMQQTHNVRHIRLLVAPSLNLQIAETIRKYNREVIYELFDKEDSQ